MRILKSLVVLTLIFNCWTSLANSEVDRLLDSYIIAKADTYKVPFTDEEAQKAPHTIQVASYINEKDAATHVEELKLQEKDVFYYPAFVRGQVWFKVCVGKFETHEKAEKYRKAFIKRMDEPFSVVINLVEPPQAGRAVASIGQKQTTPLPGGTSTAGEAPTDMSVTLVKKAVEKVHAQKKEEHKPSTVEQKVEKAMTAPVPTPTPVMKMAAATPTPVKAMDSVHVSGGAPVFYSLQVGAYASERLAQEQLNKVAPGQKVFVRQADVNGKTWFRAFVGEFSSHKDATEFQKSLSGTESFVRKLND